MRAAGLPDNRPLPEQLAEASADAAEFAQKLRYMAGLVRDSDRHMADALGRIAEELEAVTVKLATDRAEELEPGSATIAEMCALLLTTVWVRGRRGFDSALETIIEGTRMEGKR